MIDAVGIADEGVGEAAEIEQAIPIGIVAGEAGDFEAEHDPDMAEGDFGGEPGEAIALDDAGAGKPEVFVDNDDLLRRPAKCRRPGGRACRRCVDPRCARPAKAWSRGSMSSARPRCEAPIFVTSFRAVASCFGLSRSFAMMRSRC